MQICFLVNSLITYAIKKMKRIAAFIISLVCVMNVFPQEKLTIEYENGDSYYGNVYVNIKQKGAEDFF